MRIGLPTLLPILPLGAPDQGYATHRVTSPFGPRGKGFHGGLDIGNFRAGDILISVGPGRVIAVGNLGLPWSQPTNLWPSGNYGGLMSVIQLDNGAIAIYAHMRRCYLTQGQRVSLGTRVGEIGDTGSATGQAHVHFGLQAPPSIVPSGVGTRATTFGIGLDIDPWPLITGRLAFLDTKEDDMTLPAGLEPIARGKVGLDNRIREAPSLTAPFRTVEASPEHPDGLMVHIYGRIPGDEWQGSTEWLEIGAYNERRYVHSLLVTDRAPTGFGWDLLPARVEVQKVDASTEQIAAARAAGIKDAAANAAATK